MVRKVWTVVALASTLALSGCGSNNLFDPTRMLSVFVELSVEPDVVNATSATGETFTIGEETVEFAWKTSFQVISSLSDEQPQATISALALLVQQATGGIIISPVPGQAESFRFDTRTDGNIITPGSSKVTEFDVWYTLPNQGREAVITVTVSYINDSGLTRTENITVRVAP